MHTQMASSGRSATVGATLLLLLVSDSLQAPWRDPSSYEPDKIYVHIVPHTHDDVGWLKTVDEYYTGGNRTITDDAVRYILDTVTEELQKDENRTFIYVEMAFFVRWWNEQSDSTKEIVKKLVSNKQLEFINGGWCMNDEAAAHYNAIIDQMTLGLQFLEDTFGPEARPRIAWQIDPFGHSNTQAALFAAMGFDGLFFARHDYDDHNLRINQSTLQLVWQPSESLGASADLFTGILYRHYVAPLGFCFDSKCVDDFIQIHPPNFIIIVPISAYILAGQDNPKLDNYNVDNKTEELIQEIYKEVNSSITNHIMFTFGSDFQYKDARMNFDNIDKLMKYTNQKNSSVELFYSTPSRFLDALHSAGKTWTVKKDDFFPYGISPYGYLTGYFTSRPALKGYVRVMNNLLQVCLQMEALGLGSWKKISDHTSTLLLKAMGVTQHHDAISGTEKQHVANDYAKRLSRGADECNALIADVLAARLAKSGNKGSAGASSFSSPAFETCPYLNVSLCSATETNNFNVLLCNPLGRAAYHAVVVPITTDSVTVYDSKGMEVPSQVSTVSDGVSRIRGNRGTAKYELYFNVGLPPLGYRTFFVRAGKTNTSSNVFVESVRPSHIDDGTVVSNDAYDVTMDPTTGRLLSISNKDSNLSLKVDQNFYWYNSSDGNNTNSTRISGAYIFRPNGTKAWDINNGSDTTVKFKVVKGPLFEEVQQTFSDWVQQNIRLHKTYPFMEFDYMVGPIPIKDKLGKEIITQFTSTADTNKTWFTDANGREMQKRVRNFRPTWKLNVTEPVAGNYYPVNSRIFMQYNDTENGPSQFTVMTDRSQGGASLNDGQLEIMVHRRILYDDNLGLAEALNEPGLDGKGLIIRGSHYVLLGNISNSTSTHRLLGEALMLKPYQVFVRDTDPPKTWMDKYETEYTGLKTSLPLNVHLLTVKLKEEGTLLVRLEHQFEAHEEPLNTTASVSLTDVFPFDIDSVTELGLAANTVAPLSRLQWSTVNDGASRRKVSSEPVTPPSYTVQLEPMQIRTFTVKIHV